MSQAKLGAPPQGTRRSGIPAEAKPAMDNQQQVLGAGTPGRGVRGLEGAMRQKPRPPCLGFGGRKRRGLTLLRLGRSPTPDIAGAVGDEAATGGQSELAKALRKRPSPRRTTPHRLPREGPPQEAPRCSLLHHVGIPPVGVFLWLGGQDPGAWGRTEAGVFLGGRAVQRPGLQDRVGCGPSYLATTRQAGQASHSDVTLALSHPALAALAQGGVLGGAALVSLRDYPRNKNEE